MPTPHTFRILHFSDPHWGRKFRKDLWNHFVQNAVEIHPHLLLITGDCVDTPWRWTLRTAKKDIDELEKKINKNRSTREYCQIRITPGNHDVRLTGLIPVRPWVTIPFLIGLIALPLLLAWSWSLLAFTTVFTISVGVGVAATVLHSLCIGQFSDVFNNRIKTKPEQFTANNIKVDLYHFDSATAPFWSAEGFVRTQDFLAATTQLQKHPPMNLPEDSSSGSDGGMKNDDAALSYAIAMTHHHALGIPNDHQHENLMIMRNSGSFLSELASKKIRLILHGHKHHQHFARVTINAEMPEEFEIGVLGAGTLTRGNPTPERYGYHFYALELDANLNMKALPYHSTDGGPFKSPSKDWFYIENLQQAIRRQRQFAQDTYGLKAGGFKATTTVYSDGDTLERIEHHDFKVTDPKKSYNALPSPAQAEVDRGHIEGFVAGPLGDDCPPAIHLQPDIDQFNLRKQLGVVMFGSDIYETSIPFKFYTQFSALNSFAMSVQQHKQRYTQRSDLEPQPRFEETSIITPIWPVDKLEIVIQFPKEFRFAGRPELVIRNQMSQQLNLIEQEYRSALLYERDTNTIRLGIPNPPPKTTFIIRWGLTDSQPPDARSIASLSGATRQLQHSLIQRIWDQSRTAINPETQAFFRSVGELVEDMVRSRILVGSSPHDPLEVSVMIYDEDTNRLRIVAGNYEHSDERATKTLEYGDGIGGKAFKSNSPRLFIKAEGLKTGKPFGYLPWTTFPSVQGIPHEVLLCVPITNPENTDLIYGILNIGSTRADSRLLQLAETEGEPVEITQKRNDTYIFINLACWTFLNAEINKIP